MTGTGYLLSRCVWDWLGRAWSGGGIDVIGFVGLHAEPPRALVVVARRALLVRHSECSIGWHGQLLFTFRDAAYHKCRDQTYNRCSSYDSAKHVMSRTCGNRSHRHSKYADTKSENLSGLV